MTETTAPAETEQKPITGGQIAAAVMGNALEFYDFTTYALFAVQIGHVFFPSHSEFATLMGSLVTFAVGFAARPVGAIVLGTLGDTIGRRPAMLASFILMGIGIIGIVLTPGYAQIGMAAPVLLVIFRLIQGFALGGEVGPTTAFLIEAAPAKHRGLIGSWQSASQAVASLVGATMGLAMTHLMTPADLESYGWRIAFGIGAIVLPFGLILRRRLPETLHARRIAPEEALAPRVPLGQRIAAVASTNARPALIGLGMIMSFTTSTYVLLYMTTYATQTLHQSESVGFMTNIANNVCGLVFALLGGFLADRLGRKPVMITARSLFLLATFPVFLWIVSSPGAVSLVGGVAILSAFSSTSVGIALVALTENLRQEVRSAGLAIIYAFGVTIFGGLAQPFITGVLRATGDPMSPAYYLMAAAAVGITAMFFLRETKPSPITDAEGGIETFA